MSLGRGASPDYELVADELDLRSSGERQFRQCVREVRETLGVLAGDSAVDVTATEVARSVGFPPSVVGEALRVMAGDAPASFSVVNDRPRTWRFEPPEEM